MSRNGKTRLQLDTKWELSILLTIIIDPNLNQLASYTV